MSQDPQWLVDARANGIVVAELPFAGMAWLRGGPISSPAENGPKPTSRPGKKEFVAAAFDGVGTWDIPVWLESEANANDKMRAAMSRKAGVKKAVWKAVGPHWRAFGPVGDAIRSGAYAAITVTRLGGRGLDTGNLWRAVKPVEDALAVLLGVDDGLPAWRSAFSVEQQPGPLWGVRVALATSAPLPPRSATRRAVRK